MKKKNLSVILSVLLMWSNIFAASGEKINITASSGINPHFTGPRLLILLALKAFQTVFAPILFLVGIIMYLKRSKGSKMKKVVIVIILILLLIGICYEIESLFGILF